MNIQNALKLSEENCRLFSDTKDVRYPQQAKSEEQQAIVCSVATKHFGHFLSAPNTRNSILFKIELQQSSWLSFRNVERYFQLCGEYFSNLHKQSNYVQKLQYIYLYLSTKQNMFKRYRNKTDEKQCFDIIEFYFLNFA